jgi:hypothetical protein
MKAVRIIAVALLAVSAMSVAGCASKAPPPAVVKG